MPSEHFVLLTTISNIKAHPNADNLEIAEIEGWQVVTGKDTFKVNDRVIFVPIDSIVPEKWALEWGVHKYLASKRHDRVKCVKLRGEPSYGFTVPIPEELKGKKNGTDVKDYFNITKYLPPVRREKGNNTPQGQTRKCHPLLQRYTSMENLRNFMGVFIEGEEVIITEKVHGSNWRCSLVDSIVKQTDFISTLLRFFHISNRTETIEELIAGSHNVQRNIPEDPSMIPYTFPLADINFKAMLTILKSEYKAKQVIVYGEVYGPQIQKLHYGIKSGYGYMVFDILIDGKYLDWDATKGYCDKFDIPMVPILFRGGFDLEMVKYLAEGKTTINNANHIREGVVVKPIVETVLNNGKRKILKCKGSDYMIWKESKKGSDYTEE